MRYVQGGTRDYCVVDDALGEHCDSESIGAVKGREYAWLSYGLRKAGAGRVHGHADERRGRIFLRDVCAEKL